MVYEPLLNVACKPPAAATVSHCKKSAPQSRRPLVCIYMVASRQQQSHAMTCSDYLNADLISSIWLIFPQCRAHQQCCACYNMRKPTVKVFGRVSRSECLLIAGDKECPEQCMWYCWHHADNTGCHGREEDKGFSRWRCCKPHGHGSRRHASRHDHVDPSSLLREI